MRKLRSHRVRVVLAVALLSLLVIAALGAAVQGMLLAPAQAPVEVQTPDADVDGVPDVIEVATGTDPLAQRPVTRLPEAWIQKYRLDVSDPELPNRTAAYPRPPQSPPVYGPLGLPAEYRMTYLEVYSYGRPADWDEARAPYDSKLDPTRWDVDGSGVPYAWLIHFGLDPFDPAVLDSRDPTGAVAWTPREAYSRGLHPRSPDGDRDGVADVEEERLGTSPRLFSTAGTGIADGWLVANNFDPLDVALAYEDTDRDGLTNLAEFEASYKLNPNATLQGRGLDPRKLSTVGGPIPDGWLVRFGMDPLDARVHEKVTEEKVLKGRDGKTEMRSLRVIDEYSVARPPLWDESKNGPWYGGSDPAKDDTDDDGMSDLEELTGREIRKSGGPKWVVSDPTRADSDRDGLLDGQEYEGRVGELTFSPTDPSAPDTDVDGLLDGEELGVVPWRGIRLPPLNPTSDDTDADSLVDGVEALYWLQRSLEAAGGALSPWGPPERSTVVKAIAHARLPEADVVEALLPGGDVDRDGFANALDADADGDGLLDGWEVRPENYLSSPYSAPQARLPTDPASDDTDEDGLPDRWEIQNGVFDERIGGWNLDPSKWSSLATDRSDADSDLDGDGTIWYAYDPVTRRPVERVYNATNRVEFESGSHPNKRATSEDGIPDGWKIFWGKTYLSLSDEELGAVYPGAPGVLAIPQDRVIPTIGADDAVTIGSAAVRVVRIVDGESFRVEHCADGRMHDVRNAAGSVVKLCVLTSERVYDYAAAARNHTNPYLDDTDGDGAPDAWEAAWASMGAARKRVSPVAPDSGEDLDEDGLDNLGEFQAGGSPYLADSDLGGAGDAVESRLRLDLFDPTDDARALDTTRDSDGDGLPDVTEVIGQLDASGNRIRTDPRDMDTDKDGLLDGRGLSEVLGRRLSRVADAALLASLEARGLMATYFNDGSWDVPGELTARSDPTRVSTGGDGVPDGWAIRYWIEPSKPTNLLSTYAFGRPAWWNESQHGVWRWGLKPGETATRDHDKDGLDDRNGEDPIPAANALNVLSRGDPRDPSINETERLLRAQAYGAAMPAEPEPKPRFNGNVTLYNLTDPLPTNGSGWFAGNVTTYDEEAPKPVRNATVILSLERREVVIGVAITNETGEFNGTVLLSSTLAAPPGSEGIPVFGALDGTGAYTNVAELLQRLRIEGRANVFAWTYNESYHPPARQVRDLKVNGTEVGALRSTNSNVTRVNLTLETRLSLEVPKDAAVGAQAEVVATLTDALGRPVPNVPVRLDPPGVNVTTDAAGKAKASVTLPPDPADVVVNATYAGGERLLSRNATAGFRTLEGTRLALAPPPLKVRPNESFLLEGRLVTQRDRPVVNATVRLSGPGVDTSLQTDEDGAFRATLALALDAPLGEVRIRGAYAGNETLLPATENATVLTGGTPRWEVSPARAALGETVSLSARLVQFRGGGLARQDVTMRLPDGTELRNRTDAEGRVGFTLDLAAARPGEVLLRLFYRDATQGDAEGVLPLTVTTTTNLTLDTGSPLRGRDAVLSGRLADASGAPLSRAVVNLSFGAEQTRVLTSAAGRFEARFDTSKLAPGRVSALASYAGSLDGVHAPSSIQVSATLRDAPELFLGSDVVLASRPVVDGRLTTLVGDPLANRELRVRTPGGDSHVVTDGEGRFQVALTGLSLHALGPVALNWTMEPEPLLLPLDLGATFTLKDVGTLTATPPAAGMQGATLRIPYAVLDSRERPVPDARLTVRLDGAPLTVDHAAGVATFTLPRDARPGEHRLDIGVTSSVVAVANRSASIDVQREVRLTLVSAPPLRPGETGEVAVKIESNGQPLAGEALVIHGGAVPFQVVTGADGVARAPITFTATDRELYQVAYAGRGEYGPAVLALQVSGASASGGDALGFKLLPWLLLALLLAVAAVAFVLLRRRRDPAQVIRRTARKLRDSRADVGALYEAYLSLLALAGLDEDAAETVTFGALLRRFLDEGDMDAETRLLTDVFNRAVYAPSMLDADSVVAASEALEKIASRVHAPREAAQPA